MEAQFNIAESSGAPSATDHSLPSNWHSTSAHPTTHPLSAPRDRGVYVALHGHFYQPPRENPYLGAIERQSSAEPFHNWNERICYECYRPNAFARILNEAGEVIEVVNNFEYLSFNIGPTLMRWLEQYDTEVYQRILEADRKSCLRLDGHGNAIAQVYNHIILPLANREDKITQIRWGKRDFQARFGRDPQGMWLAEAAVDYPTLEVLIAEGIKFIILAPSQVERCRPIAPEADPDGLDYPWQGVSGGQIDPTQPYRCFLPNGDRNSDFIDVFVYDGPISRDIGFEDILSSSERLASRLAQAVRHDRESSQLIAIATDGETFGHHKRSTEKALAYGFRYAMPQRGWVITNFSHFLSLHPPTWEVELKPVTAWSCAHGVDRWQDDCGCGGGDVWHQQWRRPLRDALDWLRDQLIEIYLKVGSLLFQDPWAARNDYGQVIVAKTTRESSQTTDMIAIQNAFLACHQRHLLSETEQVNALRLLEMQHNALLMYTSCGWFFEEISRPEGVQILRYAAKAIALAKEISEVDLEAEFIERLAFAPSNVEQFKTGAQVYTQLVLPSQVTLHQVVAHYAMSSLFRPYAEHHTAYCYQTHQLDYETHRMGNLTLAVGQLQITVEDTRETVPIIFAVLHMGGWDFHCVIQKFTGRPYYTALKKVLFEQLQQASVPRLVLAMNQYFGDRYYGIQDLFAEDRHQLLDLLSQATLMRLAQQYTQIYRDNHSLLAAYRQDNLTAPQELLVAAEVALSHRAIQTIQSLMPLEHSITDATYRLQLTQLATCILEAEQLGCRLNLDSVVPQLHKLLHRWLWHALYRNTGPLLRDFCDLLKLVRRLQLPVPEDRLQELYIQFLQKRWVPHSLPVDSSTHRGNPTSTVSSSSVEPSQFSVEQVAQLQPFLQLGRLLCVDMRHWLTLWHYHNAVTTEAPEGSQEEPPEAP